MNAHRGIVFELGDGGREAASYVVHLKNWPRIGGRDSVDLRCALRSGGVQTVLCVVSPELQSVPMFLQLARVAAEFDPRIAIGFLYGRFSHELLDSAKRIPRLPRVSVGAGKQALSLQEHFRHFVGGAHANNIMDTVSGEAHAVLLKHPYEVLYLVGHGNGQDAGYGRAVMCRQPSEPLAHSDPQLYPCYHGVSCRYLDRGYVVVSSDSLRAKRVVNLSCWGVTLSDGPFLQGSTVGEGLLRHSAVGSLITLIRPAPLNRDDYLLTYYLVNSGLPFGEVANRVNSFRIDRKVQPELLCFGDPESCIVDHLHHAGPVDGDGVASVEPSAVPRDVQISFPKSWARVDAVGVLELGGVFSGAVFTSDGDLFLTIPPSTDATRVRITIGEQIAPPDIATKLLLNLQFSEIFISAFLERFSTSSDADATAVAVGIAAQMEFLKRLLGKWPLVDTCFGMVFSREEIASYQRSLRQSLIGVSSAFLSGYADILERLGYDALSLTSEYYRFTGQRPADNSCPYCGSAILEQLRSTTFKDSTRYHGYCDACGFVYSGTHAAGIHLKAPFPLVIGREHSVSTDVTNPYTFECPAQAVFILQRFSGGGSPWAITEVITLLAGQSVSLNASFNVPHDFTPGLHWLHCAFIVGSHLNFLKRPVSLS